MVTVVKTVCDQNFESLSTFKASFLHRNLFVKSMSDLLPLHEYSIFKHTMRIHCFCVITLFHIDSIADLTVVKGISEAEKGWRAGKMLNCIVIEIVILPLVFIILYFSHLLIEEGVRVELELHPFVF